MTLGCGGWGGNITSDNISPRHLLNIKRLAYETTPAVVRPAVTAAAGASPAAGAGLPRPPAPPAVPGGIAADVLARRIDEFLSSRGYRPAPAPSGGAPSAPLAPLAPLAPQHSESPQRSESAQRLQSVEKAADFVCEDDVRQALKQSRKIVIGERTIVTPAARDLGEQHRLFVQASWPR
jgi:acetaldehyde dehydrogenase (acetylating)